jgi:hypothetical protein
VDFRAGKDGDMNRQFQMAVLMAGSFLVSSSGAISANLCTAIGLNDPEAHQLYFQKIDDTGERVWLPFTSFAATGMPVRAKIRFAYVAKEQSEYNLNNELERSGVLVLKSGQYLQPTPPTNADTVRLVRNGSGADYSCRAHPASHFGMRQTVSAISYDLYHDKANEDAPDFRTEGGKKDLAKIRRFHVAYGDDRYPNCISTDSVAVPFSGMPNNRSQFSYRPTTVQYGIVRDTVSWFSTPAIAQPLSLTQRRTEILPYRTVSGTACVTFLLQYSAPTQFLYVDDLEGRLSRGVREPEQRFN